MRTQYHKNLKSCFHSSLVHTREAMELPRSQMAVILAMDDRSYVSLDHGKNCCSATTLALFLVCCCSDPLEFLEELKEAIEEENRKCSQDKSR